jgi:hypothetical protein
VRVCVCVWGGGAGANAVLWVRVCPSPTAGCVQPRAKGGRMSLSAEQEADCQEAFTLFDRGGAGKLKVAELGGVLRALGHNLAGEELSVTSVFAATHTA